MGMCVPSPASECLAPLWVWMAASEPKVFPCGHRPPVLVQVPQGDLPTAPGHQLHLPGCLSMSTSHGLLASVNGSVGLETEPSPVGVGPDATHLAVRTCVGVILPRTKL